MAPNIDPFVYDSTGSSQVNNLAWNLAREAAGAGVNFLAARLAAQSDQSTGRFSKARKGGGGDAIGCGDSTVAPRACRDVPGLNSSLRDRFGDVRPMIGEHLIPSLSTNRLTSIVLGSPSKCPQYDAYANFLSNLQQNATVSCQFAGRISTNSTFQGAESSGARTVICQNFRHRFSSNQITFPLDQTQIAYPTGNGLVLTPTGDQFTVGGAGVNAINIDSAFHEHQQFQNCWAPFNRGDLEDMMWNLNKLKLAPAFTGNNVVPSQPNMAVTQNGPNYDNNFLINNALQMKNSHLRQSSIEKNNLQNAAYIATPPTDPFSKTSEAGYRYEAVYKGGHVKYNFRNKEDAGARVEIIVYKCKKNQRSTNDVVKFSDANDPTTIHIGSELSQSNPLSNIIPSIKQGYNDTYYAKLGTEDFQGQDFDANAIVTNPEYPLLPTFSKTVKSQCNYKEHYRTAFALPAGGHRSITVKMDGLKFDPANSPSNKIPQLPVLASPTPFDYALLPAIIDEYTYNIVIAVCGVKMNREVWQKQSSTGGPNVEHLDLGDLHCNATVEYTAEYVEDIAAATYKKAGKVRLFNNALAKDTVVLANANALVRPSTVIPVERTVRVTQSTTVDPNLQTTSINVPSASSFAEEL